MSFKIKAEIDGMREVLAALDGITKAFRRRILKKALRAAARPVLHAARARVPVRYGDLKKALFVIVKTVKGKPDIVLAIVGPRTGRKRIVTPTGGGKPISVNPTYYAHLVEFGAAPHTIPHNSPTRLSGHFLPPGDIIHPGSRPQPFLRPALDENKSRIRSIIAEEITAGIEEQTAKAAAKGKSIFA